MMDDFALLTGGKYVQEELGDDIKEVTLDMLGQAEKVTIRQRPHADRGRCRRQGSHQRTSGYAAYHAENAKNEFDVDKARERLGKLGGGAAVIRVGAPTEIEMKENKLRIEDALNATVRLWRKALLQAAVRLCAM